MSDVDLLVVGSGPVGATFARVVTGHLPLARVLVVDLGPLVTTPPGANVRNLPPDERAPAQAASQGPGSGEIAADVVATGTIAARPGTHLLRRLPAGTGDQAGMPAAAMSSNVGGMGAHWTCATPRPHDGEVIDAIPPAELDAAFARAEALLAVTRTGFPDTPTSAAVRARLSEAFDAGRPAARRVQPMPLACTPGPNAIPLWSGADTVFGNAPVELRPGTLCRELLMNGDRVSGAVLEDLATGARTTVTARAVAVAADALRTPQLLWASGIRTAALGRHLNDQPQIVAPAYVDGTSAGDAAEISREHLTGVQWVPYHEPDHPHHGQVMQLDASPVAFGADPDEQRAVVGLGWFCAKDIRAEDRLEFSAAQSDACGMPAITVHYGLTDVDLKRIDSAVDALRRAGQALGELAGEPRLLPAGSSLHYQGSVRMSRADDGTGVCDRHGRIHGVRNLYVGGNGVIPTPTACNPTLTSVALAVLAADRIARQLEEDR